MLEIMDTVGTSQFAQIVHEIRTWVHVGLLDDVSINVGQPSALDHLEKLQVKETLVVVTDKCDLEYERAVDREQGLSFVKQFGDWSFFFLETSMRSFMIWSKQINRKLADKKRCKNRICRLL